MKIVKLIIAVALLIGTGTLWALSSAADGDPVSGCALEAVCESTDCSDCDGHEDTAHTTCEQSK